MLDLADGKSENSGATQDVVMVHGHDQTELIKFCICVDNICFGQHSNTSKFNLQTALYYCCKKKKNI